MYLILLMNNLETISEEIINGLRKGEKEAQNSFIRTQRENLYIWLRYKFRISHEDAEDVLQDTFFKVFEKADTYQGRNNAQFLTWVYTIARNYCFNYIRKNKNSLNNNGEILQKDFTEKENPYDYVLANQFREHVEIAMSGMSKEQADILGFLTEDCGEKEIADRTKIPRGTVKSRTHHARRKLLRYLSDEGIPV